MSTTSPQPLTARPAPPKTQRLLNRVAIITGSSGGLGSSICLAFASEGASVFCVDLSPSARPITNPPTSPGTGTAEDFLSARPLNSSTNQALTQGTHEKIRQIGGEAAYHKADVTHAQEVELAIRACVHRYGRVDIIVNCAGIAVEINHARPLRCHETSEEDYERAMSVNARGTFLCCKYVLKQFLEQPQVYESRGWVVNIASVMGLAPSYCIPSYCASKGAVVMLTKQIALDYAQDGIHANAVCPGYLNTEMTRTVQADQAFLSSVVGKQPLGGGRLGSSEDVARMVVVLASDDAKWMTGVPVVVDGGYMLR